MQLLHYGRAMNLHKTQMRIYVSWKLLTKLMTELNCLKFKKYGSQKLLYLLYANFVWEYKGENIHKKWANKNLLLEEVYQHQARMRSGTSPIFYCYKWSQLVGIGCHEKGFCKRSETPMENRQMCLHIFANDIKALAANEVSLLISFWKCLWAFYQASSSYINHKKTRIKTMTQHPKE